MNTYSTQEVAKILKVKPFTVRQYILNRELEASVIGRGYVVTEESLQEFIKNKVLFKDQ